ncbi:MAG: nitrous oxide reductase accessory protein NosL [bacterium]|jgi:copper chaperone NosL
MKRRTFFNACAVVVLTPWVGSCEQDNPQQLPIPLTWDRDVCTQCRMAISDRFHAAQVIAPQGKGHVFDDIGCALKWLKQSNFSGKERIWVSDVADGEWIEAKRANWRAGDETPMGYGFGASRQPLEPALSFDEVKRRLAQLRTSHQKGHTS